MTTTVHAIFENGVFRPVEPIALPELTSVELEVRVPGEQQPQPPMPPGLAKVYSILGERYNSGHADTAARHDRGIHPRSALSGRGVYSTVLTPTAINCDVIDVAKNRMGALLTTLSAAKMRDVSRAVAFALNLGK